MALVQHESYGSIDPTYSEDSDASGSDKTTWKHVIFFVIVVLIILFFVSEIIVGFVDLHNGPCNHFARWHITHGFLMLVMIGVFFWFPHSETIIMKYKFRSFCAIVSLYGMCASSMSTATYMFFTTDIKQCGSEHIYIILIISVVMSFIISHIVSYVSVHLYFFSKKFTSNSIGFFNI